jgi:hypothetical protein
MINKKDNKKLLVMISELDIIQELIEDKIFNLKLNLINFMENKNKYTN